MKKLIAVILVAMLALAGLSAMAEVGIPVLEAGENGTLVLATNANFPPYEFYDDETSLPTGIDIEIAKAICQKIGYGLEVVDIDFGSIIPGLVSNNYDFAAAGMTVTEERKQSVDFTDTYAIGIQAVIVPGDTEAADIYALLEAKGGHLVIGVQESTTGDIYISDEFETAGTADVQRFKNGADAVLALTSGQVDCVVIDNEPAKAFVAKNEGLKLLNSAYTEEEYAMAFPKGSEYYEAFNTALNELMEDGTLKGIVDQFIPAEN